MAGDEDHGGALCCCSHMENVYQINKSAHPTSGKMFYAYTFVSNEQSSPKLVIG